MKINFAKSSSFFNRKSFKISILAHIKNYRYIKQFFTALALSYN